MDCGGMSTGPITRRRAKLIQSLVDQNFENKPHTNCTAPFEVSGGLVNQNDKTSKKKIDDPLKDENEPLACGEPTKSSNLNLLDILDNLVCRTHLLSFLQVNDLLRLRRVCKSTKQVSQDFIQTQNVSTRQPLKISFRESIPFEEFTRFQRVSNPLPTRASLHVTFCHRHRPPILFARCTSNVTHLTILRLQLPIIKKSTLNFFESCPNVTHLVLDNIQEPNDYSIPPTIKIHEMFRNLKSLKIVDSHGTGSKNAFMHIKKLVETCVSNLELLSLPFYQIMCWSGNQFRRTNDVVSLACTCIFSETNLKLEGVTGSLIEMLISTDNRTPEMRGRDEMIRNINAKIVSIVRPTTAVFLEELPNMEKINFENLIEYVVPHPQLVFIRKDWPKLKEIRVHFKDNEDNPHLGGLPLRQLWDFLFVGVVRKNVVELHLSFSGFNGIVDTYKWTPDIINSCPNVKTIYFKSASWKLVHLPQLWRGLSRLEKLTFDRCSYLSNKHFIGEDSENPAFLKLKNLKVLEFLDMDEMDVTDDLLSKVLSQMPLKELCLSCNKYCDIVVKKITLKGVRSLLSGKFASTVERLCIEGLRIRGVKHETLKRLESRFRSSKMH